MSVLSIRLLALRTRLFRVKNEKTFSVETFGYSHKRLRILFSQQLTKITQIKVRQNQITPNQARDTGLALLLILLLIVYFSENVTLIIPGIGVLVLIMVWPKIFSPLAPFWFGLSNLLGTIVSKFILSLLFFLIVTPVGIFRRMLGKDSMRLKDWRNGRDSVLLERNHTFTKKDIDKPY